MKVESQNLSIMMTDIQGYTNASSVSSRSEIVEIIRNHNRLMIPVIKFYGGTIIKSIGDAFLVTFKSSTDAVVCAIIIQLILKEYNGRQKDESKKMKLRVVVNSGDVTLEGNDIFGDAVNVTARMEGLECFPGGTIGISESTFLLMNRNEIFAELIGPQTMKGIPLPVNVYKIPLEKQTLNQIPTRLLELVEYVVQNQGAPTGDLEKEIGQFLYQTKSQYSAGGVTKDQPVSLPPKTEVLPTYTQVTFKDRMKSGFLDFFVLILLIKIFRIPPVKVFGFQVIIFTLFWWAKQASIGQIVFGLEVRRLDNQPLSFFQALLRALLFFPLSFFFFFLIFLGKRQPLHDIIVGSKIVNSTVP